MLLSKTISQYIGANLATYITFLILAIFIVFFLFWIFKQAKDKRFKIIFLVFIISFLGLSLFPYGLFNDTISSIHQIFADTTFISSLLTGIILFARNRKPSQAIFILYSIIFIFAYIFKIAPFRATELVWETLYFILFLSALLSNCLKRTQLTKNGDF